MSLVTALLLVQAGSFSEQDRVNDIVRGRLMSFKVVDRGYTVRFLLRTR